MSSQSERFHTFAEFYPFYLDQHRHPVCRRLHIIGSLLVVALLLYSLIGGRWSLLLFLPLIGYGFAWIGHLFFEKNRPATFSYPLYSFIGDWVMLRDVLLGRIRF